MKKNKIDPKHCGVIEFVENKTKACFVVRNAKGVINEKKRLVLEVGKIYRAQILCVILNSWVRSPVRRIRKIFYRYKDEGIEIAIHLVQDSKDGSLKIFLCPNNETLPKKKKYLYTKYSETYDKIRQGGNHEVTLRDIKNYEYVFLITGQIL